MLSKYAQKKAIRHLSDGFEEVQWNWLRDKSEFVNAVSEAVNNGGDMEPVRQLGLRLVAVMPSPKPTRGGFYIKTIRA
jgi:hypothetical protein